MASNNHALIITEHRNISDSDKISILKLVYSIWPSKDGIEHSIENSTDEVFERFFTDRPGERHIVLKCDNIVSGYAKVFLREIMIGYSYTGIAHLRVYVLMSYNARRVTDVKSSAVHLSRLIKRSMIAHYFRPQYRGFMKDSEQR